MTHTENDHQKSDHMSWVEWINEALDRANGFYEVATTLKLFYDKPLLK
jgi:hypothetical protein